MDGPIEFIEGIASGSRRLTGSVVGGIACAGCKITGVISKSLATLTFDKDYQSTRIQRKALAAQTTTDVVRSGKIVAKVCCIGCSFHLLFSFEIGCCK
jgi:hypothetical protein